MNVRLISLGVVGALSMGTVAAIVAKRHSVQNMQAFTLYERESFYVAGKSTPLGTSDSVRYQKADGSWRKDSTCGGKPTLGFGQAGRGVFRVDEANKKLDYLSGPQTTIFTDAMLRGQQGFVREEFLLGFKTFLIHSENAETGETNDFYVCPALQGYPLKRVTMRKDGSTTVFEVNRVVLGDPPESVFASLPNYSVEDWSQHN